MAEQKQKKAGLTISLGRRPKVLLLGNGMNRVYGGASWAGLLEKINRTSFTADQVKSMPFPMQAVLLSRDQVDVSLQDLQRELTQCEVHPWLGEQLRRLLAMPFDCILTPNFTYEVECAPVSYTHLDVYKRQIWHQFRRNPHRFLFPHHSFDNRFVVIRAVMAGL